MSATGGRPSEGDPFIHLSDAELAAFLEHDPSPTERRRLEAHVEVCADCRSDLIELRRITGSVERRPARSNQRWGRRWIAALAAAGIAGLVIMPRLTNSPAPVVVAQRSANVVVGEARGRIEVVAPAEDSSVAPQGVAFTWHASASDAYRVTVLTETGDPVWSGETTDTTAKLPPSARLESGHTYFWRVEGIEKGIVATSGVRRLHIAP